MKHFTNWLFWLAMATSLIPISYFIYKFYDNQFLDSTMGNWFATIIGIIVGIPIALEINRRQQIDQNKKEQTALEQEKVGRKRKILTLLREELSFNHRILETLVEEQEQKPRMRLLTGQKDALWSALSSSGDLQWIDELDLLSSLSVSYYYIRTLIYLERQYDDPNFLSAIKWVSGTDPGYTYAGESVVKIVLSLRPDALKIIEQTIQAIDNYLGKLNVCTS
jgi:hypothetical protein